MKLRYPVDTGRKLNVNKTFRRRPGRLMYVQFTSCVIPGYIAPITVNDTCIMMHDKVRKYIQEKRKLFLMINTQ